MSWRPSQDKQICREETTALWRAIEGIYSDAVPLSSLPRRDPETLQRAYICDRKGDKQSDTEAMLGRVPPEMRKYKLGRIEIELLDLLINHTGSRLIVLQGPRGAGKTSLLHYVETIAEASGFNAPPTILKVNGLELNENASEIDLVKHVRGALQVCPPPPNFPANLVADAANRLRRSRSFSAVSEAFASMSRQLVDRQRNRLVLAFDNLDQLSPTTLRLTMTLAQQAALAAGIAALVCLRPACFEGALRKGSAHAFYCYRIDVAAPRVETWLRQLAVLAEASTHRQVQQNAWTSNIYGIKLAPDHVRESIVRLIELLQGRRSDDDVFPILQAVSADDTRHLNLLISRILSNRNLPASMLITGQQYGAQFHPLPALFDGSLSIFRDSVSVPNLLWLDCQDDSPKLLLHHRVLHLLGDSGSVQTEKMLSYLRLLGYGDDQSHVCLNRMIGSLLVRGTDSERYDARNPPSGLFLTEAGQYYRNYLLANPDYLLAAVLDVPLEHAEIAVLARTHKTSIEPKEIDFVLRLRSLVEYALEVKKKETNQVFRLLKLPSSAELRRVTFALRKGGLLLISIRDAMAALSDRGYYTTSNKVKAAIGDLPTIIDDLSNTISTLEDRLLQIENKGRANRLHVPTPQSRTVGSDEFLLTYGDDADGLTVNVQVSAHPGAAPMFIGVSAQDAGSEEVQVGVAYPVVGGPEPGQRASGRINSADRLETSALSLSNAGSKPLNVQIQALQLPRGDIKRIALLSPTMIDGKLILTFRTLSDTRRQADAHDVGKPIERKRLLELTGNALCRVGECSDEQIRESLLIQGTRLADELLSIAGKNTFCGCIGLIDTLVIFMAEADLAVPWEWLRPRSSVTDKKSSMLCEHWNIIRWPAAEVDALYQLADAESPPLAAPLTTYGLRNGKNKTWRRKCPKTLSALREDCSKCATVHISGHYDGEDSQLQVGHESIELLLSADSVSAIRPVPEGCNVILSGCAVGAAEHNRNIALTLVRHYGCLVWTPLVAINEAQVEKIDQHLGDFIKDSPTATIVDFFRKLNAEVSWSNVYVRYGFGSKPVSSTLG